ncbi:hypothetical protein FAVG1_06563 [Fusarium avenaceum]|nr:hypothetical protein FAVG1_06563 [Fusarium avenaceum]
MTTLYEPPCLQTLAPEIYKIIMEELETKELFSLMLTSRAINHLTIPSFYKKIYTREKTACDTRGLVRLLTEKPWIKDLVHYLVIDEMDGGAYRELLGFDLPNLEAVLLQHEGKVKLKIDEEEKERLNQSIIPKPRLTNCMHLSLYYSTAQLVNLDISIVVLNIMRNPWNYAPENRRYPKFTINDAILFKHSSLTRLRISYVNLTALENASDDMFPFENLTHLLIEISCINLGVFKKMLSPVKKLAVFRFHQELHLPFSFEEFRQLFWRFRRTLRALKLEWRRIQDGETIGLDLSDFPALRILLGDPEVLFGQWKTCPDLIDQLKRRLPPNIRILTLIQFCWRNVDDGSQQAAWDQYGYVGLLRTIVHNKKEILPYLRYLLYQDSDKLMIPDNLAELAEEQKIDLWSAESCYDPDPLEYSNSPWNNDDEAQEES